jgi:hypothetical protein
MDYSVFDQVREQEEGSLRLVGVDTFLPKEGASDIVTEIELIRSAEEEKGQQIDNVRHWLAQARLWRRRAKPRMSIWWMRPGNLVNSVTSTEFHGRGSGTLCAGLIAYVVCRCIRRY